MMIGQIQEVGLLVMITQHLLNIKSFVGSQCQVVAPRYPSGGGELTPPPVLPRGVVIYGIWRDSRSRMVIDKDTVVPVPIVKTAGVHLPGVSQGMMILNVRESARIGRFRARIIKYRSVRCRGNVFLPGDVTGAKGKVAIIGAQKRAMELRRVGVLRDTVVRRRGIEFGKEQLAIALTVVKCLREQQLRPAGELLTIGCAATVGLQTPGIRGDFHSVEIPALLGDDIDDAEKRVRAIERRAWALDYFHSLDQVDIKSGLGANISSVINAVVDPVPVN